MAKIYLLNNQKFDGVENLEVFKTISLKYSVDVSKYDALVFTSKNAIFSLEENGINWKNIPSYLIAPKTAKEAEKLGANIAFIGESGHGDDFANELIPYLKNKKVLYLKALKTVSNLPEILRKNGVDLDEIVVYKTTCNEDLTNIDLEKESTIIFTSPSSVECFFKRFSWDSSFKAIVIGKTTSNYLPKLIKEYKTSSKTDVKECVKLALNNFP